MTTKKQLIKSVKKTIKKRVWGLNFAKLNKIQVNALNRITKKTKGELNKQAKKLGIMKPRKIKKPQLAIQIFNKTKPKINLNLRLKKVKKDVRKLPAPKTDRKNEKDLAKMMVDLVKGIKKKVKVDINKVPIDTALKIIKKIGKNAKVLININGDHFTMNDKTLRRLIRIVNEARIRQTEVTGSDGRIIASIVVQKFFDIEIAPTLKFLKSGKAKKKRGGKFFCYNHKLDIDLTKYGIYKVGETDNGEVNCLYEALKQGGLKESKLMKLKTMIFNSHIPMAELKKVAKILKIFIKLRRGDDNNRKFLTYGEPKNKAYEIALWDDHYFILDEVRDSDGEIFKHGGLTFNNSYKLVRYLIDNKEELLQEIDFTNNDIFKTHYYGKITKFNKLDYDDECVRPVLNKERKEQKKYKKYYFDFETYVHKWRVITRNKETGEIIKVVQKNKHIPYLCCYIDEDGNERSFVGENCGKLMLNTLTEDSLLIAHNAGYDFRFVLKYLYGLGMIEKGNGLFQATGFFGSKNNGRLKITIKDSYKHISMPLRKFKKSFFKDTAQGKEIMPYSVYNKKNVKAVWHDINKIIKYVNKEDREQFIKNVEKWDLYMYEGSDEFDIVEYSKKYCEIDCSVLKKGYEVFRGWMKQVTALDIDDYLSSASLIDKYLKDEGVYDGCYELSGVVREFIQQCVVGGRTMCRDNKKWAVEKELDDLDGCSLYPSAMYRIDGYLMGKPKVLKNLNKEFLKKVDGYFVEIKINKVGKNLHFPLMSYLNKDNVRTFSNDMKGRTMFVDKYSLEDMMEFQKVQYTILRGYYFDEGRNKKINKVMEFLYTERLKKKGNTLINGKWVKTGTKKPIESVYKLLMNSSYGKTIQKAIEKDTIIKANKKQLDKYVQLNYNTIESYTQIADSDKYKIKIYKSIIDHYSRPHIGAEVLAMSKRIMNEVMCLAEDVGAVIYYQDTDSTHIEKEHIPKLEKAYREKYNKELQGNYLGEFNCDFDGFIKGGTEPVSVKSYFLGKKCYFDKLMSIKDGKKYYSYHSRMKGIPEHTLRYEALSVGGVENLYNILHKGIPHKFNLLKKADEDGNIYNATNFVYNKDMSISTNDCFTRKLKF